MTNHFLHDTSTLLGRSLRHILRSPDTIITTAITPIAMLLMFVYVFGGAINTGGAPDVDLDADLVALLDDVFLAAVPLAGRLLRLLEERSWTGWTKLQRIGTAS